MHGMFLSLCFWQPVSASHTLHQVGRVVVNLGVDKRLLDRSRRLPHQRCHDTKKIATHDETIEDAHGARLVVGA